MKLIKLTEITKEGDGTKFQPMLINPDIIATVTTGKLANATDGGIHIVGQTKTDSLTFIQFKNNSGAFVQESLDQVEQLVAEK